MKMYTILKQYVFKPAYELLFRISPNLADWIESQICKVKAKHTYNKVFLKQCLCIDISVVVRQDKKTGIQRVVNNIFNEIKNNWENVIGTQLYNGKIVSDYSLIYKKNELREIELGEGSHVLFLDSAWNYYRDAQVVLDKLEHGEIESSVVIYDMFPLTHPEWFPSNHFKHVYYKWCKLFFNRVDNVICISQKVANDVIEYYEKEKISRSKKLNIFYIPMGADILIDTNINESMIRKEIKNLFSRPTYIMVGTVEPRKGHNIVLKALKNIFNSDIDVQLLIIGKDGWSNQEFKVNLQNSAYYNKKIFWYQDITDAELVYCYKNAEALIAASIDEGYGLPIIEAAYYGLPIICSDIPIFREVTCGNASFFKVNNYKSLTNTIAFCFKCNAYLDSSKIKIYTWNEVSNLLIKIITKKATPYQIIK